MKIFCVVSQSTDSSSHGTMTQSLGSRAMAFAFLFPGHVNPYCSGLMPFIFCKVADADLPVIVHIV